MDLIERKLHRYGIESRRVNIDLKWSWCAEGVLRGCPRSGHRVLMVCSWCAHNVLMECLRSVHEVLMKCSQSAYGVLTKCSECSRSAHEA